jgi:anti-sigma B factor antagonist
MSSFQHNDEIYRSQMMVQYLSRSLDAETQDAFEDHYLSCQDCFEELRATELLILGLGQPIVQKTVSEDVTVIRFAGSVQLTGASNELAELGRKIHGSGDTKVLIDLSRVSRIDSAGLGMLMNCYTHAVRNAGMLKLLHPNPQVQQVLAMTRIDTVVDTFHDEDAAITSFQ